jgi:hypothetical protein
LGFAIDYDLSAVYLAAEHYGGEVLDFDPISREEYPGPDDDIVF